MKPHSLNLNFSIMDEDKLALLTFSKNLGYLLLGFGFMDFFLSFVEQQLFEKNVPNNKFLVLVENMHFLAF